MYPSSSSRRSLASSFEVRTKPLVPSLGLPRPRLRDPELLGSGPVDSMSSAAWVPHDSPCHLDLQTLPVNHRLRFALGARP